MPFFIGMKRAFKYAIQRNFNYLNFSFFNSLVPGFVLILNKPIRGPFFLSRASVSGCIVICLRIAFRHFIVY